MRRNPTDRDLAYFTVWCPDRTTFEKLVQVEGTRWRIEEGFRTAKNELGLDYNETRSWHGWHRHVSLVIRAYVLMASIRTKATQKDYRTITKPDLMVHSGNPAPYRQIDTETNIPRLYPSLVTLSKKASGNCLCLSNCSARQTVYLTLSLRLYHKDRSGSAPHDFLFPYSEGKRPHTGGMQKQLHSFSRY